MLNSIKGRHGETISNEMVSGVNKLRVSNNCIIDSN